MVNMNNDDTDIEFDVTNEEDSEMELYANNVLVNEVLIKAELSEQKLEEVLINSLFVEDSLIDNYTSKSLIENLIL